MKNPSDINAIGKHLKQLRQKAKLTQNALAFDAGIGRRTIQEIEAGEKSMTVDLLISICRALGIQPEEFFKGFVIEIEE